MSAAWTPAGELRRGSARQGQHAHEALAPEPMAYSDVLPSREPIAIIGMACMFPSAPDLTTYWQNILRGVDAVSEPEPAWDKERYLSSGRIQTAFGGYLKDLYHFNPTAFGIMPTSLDGGEPDQFLALQVTAQALVDAGYAGTDTDHVRTGVILGHSTYLHRGQGTLIQNHIVLDQTLEILSATCPQLTDEQLAEARAVLQSRLPASNVDIAPALVPNVMTGRIANRLNLKGPNYLIDAACSSSLLAVSAAMDELRAGRSDMMLAGGVNASLPAEVAVIFTQLGALSARGKVRPFEEGSDGTLLGEGLGTVVLKRLSDARAAGDRVYAILHSVGQASDGRGQGLLAPSEEGETLAIARAYSQSGVDPQSVSLIEAHGTGIPLGDRTEIASLKNVFVARKGAAEGHRIALGSVKSMLSHCIPAAGIAGLIKTALCLHHRVLAPTLCEKQNPELGIVAPLYLNTRAAPWLSPAGEPRRAGVNSFGFGGINTHAILEQAPPDTARPVAFPVWDSELCVLSAESVPALRAQLAELRAALQANPDWALERIAKALCDRDQRTHCRLALVAATTTELSSLLEQADKRLASANAEPRWATRSGIFFSEQPRGGELAFLFPGEGSQYPHMLADLAMVFAPVRQWLDFWAGLYDEPAGQRRTDIAFPPGELRPSQAEALHSRLHDMDVGSEAVFVGGQAMYALLCTLGVRPDVMLGHSSGESSALAASGALCGGDRAALAAAVRELNGVYQRVLRDGKIPTGALLAVGALDAAAVRSFCSNVSGEIAVAMDNCKNQLIVYGPAVAIAELEHVLGEAGAICLRLPFDRGYHTPAFSHASQAFLDYYQRISLTAPALPLYSCANADLFPTDAEAVRGLAAAQWSRTVRFRETIENMYERGVRAFIEVGPGGNLTSFVQDILAGRDYLAVASNQRSRSGLKQLLSSLAQLYVDQRPVDTQQLFAVRRIASLDLTQHTEQLPRRKIKLDNTMPMVRLTQTDRARLAALGTPARGSDLPSQAAAAAVAAPAVAAAAVVAPAVSGFLQHVERTTHQLRAECPLDPIHHTFLRDHVLSGPVSGDPNLLGLACVPLMVSLEIMAQAACLLVERREVRVVRDVAAFDWIALDAGPLTLQVRAELVAPERRTLGDISGESTVVLATLFGPAGPVVKACYEFGPLTRQLAALPPLREPRAPSLPADELYSTGMFHGPTFQSIVQLDGWDETGIDATLAPLSSRNFFYPGSYSEFVLQPVLLDAMGQLAAYFIHEYAGTDFNCFPSTIERIELGDAGRGSSQATSLRARQQPVDPNNAAMDAVRTWDFECLAPDGTTLVRVQGLVNVFFAVPHRFYELRRDPLGGFLGTPPSLAVAPGLLLWELALLPLPFCTQSSGIFVRIIAQCVLAPEERQEWQALKVSPAQRRQWLLGRLCLKEAVRRFVYESTGQIYYNTDVIVRHDAAGAPYVTGCWQSELQLALQVSLTHDDQACLAAVVGGEVRIGIDRESRNRIQSPGAFLEFLTPVEREQLGPSAPHSGEFDPDWTERLLRLWCAKEAAAKLWGTGFDGKPEHFEVHFADQSFNQALVVHPQGEICVDIACDATTIVALASAHHQEQATPPVTYYPPAQP